MMSMIPLTREQFDAFSANMNDCPDKLLVRCAPADAASTVCRCGRAPSPPRRLAVRSGRGPFARVAAPQPSPALDSASAWRQRQPRNLLRRPQLRDRAGQSGRGWGRVAERGGVRKRGRGGGGEGVGGDGVVVVGFSSLVGK